MITRHIVISTCQIKQTFDLVLTYNWLLVQAYNLFFKCNAFLLIIKNKLQAKEKYKYEKVVIGEKVISKSIWMKWKILNSKSLLI